MLQDLLVTGFEWDAGNWPKCAKHGLSREEIEAVFATTPFVAPARTVTPETRYAAIGRTPSGQHAFIVFTLRSTGSGTLIRPFRPATCTPRRCSTMKASKALKPLPVFATDQEAEDFVDQADLTEYEFSQFAPARFEFKAKTANISMRVPQDLLDAVKQRAAREGMPYQRFIRQTLEHVLAAKDKKAS